MSTPDSNNIMVGSGEVWFNRKEIDGTYKGYRHLGNVSKLDITPTPTVIEKNSSMDGSRAVIARATTETKMTVDMTLDEFDPKNVALAFLGDDSDFTQSSGTKTGATLGDAHLGYAIDTGFNNIVVTDVKHSSTTYVEGTDYTVDAVSGLITILETGTIVEGDALTWDGSVPAIASTQIQGMTNGTIEGMLRYRSSADQVGPRQQIDIYRLSIQPSGAISMIGDAWAEIPMQGEALKDLSKAVGQQFCRVLMLPAAA